MSESYAAPCPHCERFFTDLPAHVAATCGLPTIETDRAPMPYLTADRWTALFWARVTRRGPDECWLWAAGRNSMIRGTVVIPKKLNGIGQLLNCTVRNRHMLAHRVAWALVNGQIPVGGQICHRCDNGLCCNPAHLYLGDHHDNMNDTVVRKRHSLLRAARRAGVEP
jgi:hypothetical protein